MKTEEQNYIEGIVESCLHGLKSDVEELKMQN